MVLSIMRKHAKSWLIKVLIGIIAVVFIFYFGYSFTAKKALKIAYVNGEVISGLEYRKAYRDLLKVYRRQYKGVWNENLIKVLDLKNRALEDLINQKLISQEAKRLGLEVTEDEIQKTIVNYPAFQINGQFDVRRYRSLLSHNRMKPEDFEATIAQDLLDKKLKQFLFAFMVVTDQEVMDQYTYGNEKIKISFVQFKPDKFEKLIKPDQASMEEFFEAHKEDYRVPEKLKVAYLVIDPDTFRDQVEVTDLEVNDYYEYHIDIFSLPKELRARHILFKLSQGATEAEDKKVRQKAQAVLEQAHQGEDFAALARKYSEGPTKSKGGDLGYFSQGQMAEPFEKAAFKLKEGEISDLVRTRFGYHIIKVEGIKEARTRKLEEVHDEIRETLITNAVTDIAHEKGLSLIDQMPYDVDLALYAAKQGFKIKYTDYFSQVGPIPGIGGDQALRKSLFSLEKNETSNLIELKGKFYIFQIADIKASYLAEIQEVSGKVKKDATAYLAAREAKATAESYLARLHGGKSWEELAKDKNSEPIETDFFTRREPVPEIGSEPDLREMVFGLSEDKRYPDTIFQNDKGAFVIRWEADKGIDKKRYKKEKDKSGFRVMQTKHGQVFENWLENLKKNAEIEIVTPVTRG